MSITSMIPWRRGEKVLPIRRDMADPLSTFHGRIDDMFERFFDDFSLAPFSEWENGRNFHPHVDVAETDQEIKVTAELPGMEEKDIEVSLSHDRLTIRGEKKEEKEEKSQHYYHMERSYGSFQRSLPLPAEVEQDKVEAAFKNGVLTVKLPKTLEAQITSKIIPVKSE